jgi:hypothetical protein
VWANKWAQCPGPRCIHLPGYGKPSQTNYPDSSSPLISHFLLPSFLFLFFLEKIPCSSLHCILTEFSLSLMQLLSSSSGFFTFILVFVYFVVHFVFLEMSGFEPKELP